MALVHQERLQLVYPMHYWIILVILMICQWFTERIIPMRNGWPWWRVVLTWVVLFMSEAVMKMAGEAMPLFVMDMTLTTSCISIGVGMETTTAILLLAPWIQEAMLLMLAMQPLSTSIRIVHLALPIRWLLQQALRMVERWMERVPTIVEAVAHWPLYLPRVTCSAHGLKTAL